jgi:hypothetical protein
MDPEEHLLHWVNEFPPDLRQEALDWFLHTVDGCVVEYTRELPAGEALELAIETQEEFDANQGPKDRMGSLVDLFTIQRLYNTLN